MIEEFEAQQRLKSFVRGGQGIARQSNPELDKMRLDRKKNAMFLTGKQKPLLVPSLDDKRIKQHRFSQYQSNTQIIPIGWSDNLALDDTYKSSEMRDTVLIRGTRSPMRLDTQEQNELSLALQLDMDSPHEFQGEVQLVPTFFGINIQNSQPHTYSLDPLNQATENDIVLLGSI